MRVIKLMGPNVTEHWLVLRLVYTRDVGLAFSLNDAILIEKFLSSQIANTSGSDKHLLFS